ncbi:MAG: hypothetical protein WD772_13245 [Pseudohongiellaceae bacterium]
MRAAFSSFPIGAAGLLLLFNSPAALGQTGQTCELVNYPAQSGYDFTETISRWGGKDSYQLDSPSSQVGEIIITNLPVFDENNSREDNDLFRWANRIHINTRPAVIRNQLLFKPGDLISSQELAENERILRRQKFASDSEIRVLQKCGEKVDLEIVTREIWTLIPGFSYHSSGGDNELSVGLRESNLLGTGQRVSVFYKSDADRDSYQLAFENPNLGNSHRVIKLQTDRNSDGNHYLAEYSLPFYALDSRSAWYLGFESTEEILTQYRFGRKITELTHLSDTAEFSRGFSAGIRDGAVNRLSYGLRYEKQSYAPGRDLPSPADLSGDLSMAYPFLQIEHIEDNFAVGYNISQIYRAEDLHLGRRLLSSVGYAPGDADRLIVQGEYSDTLFSRPKMLLQWNADWYGRWNQQQKRWEDSVMKVNLDFHRGQTQYRTLYLGFNATRAVNLENGKQVTLDGSNGLRGFDNHYLNGDGSVRFTAEQRIFTNYHPLQLFRLGFAAFADIGRIFGGVEDGAGRTFSDVGVGLRLAPSKSDSGKVIHIDLAYPLQADIPGGRSVQLVMEAKVTF